MPELPEVRTIVKQLANEIASLTIIDLKVLRNNFIKEISADEFKNKVIGQKITKVANRAKFILIFLENKYVIVNHLRMEGKFRLEKDYEERKHDYLIFTLSNGYKLIYNDTRMFGSFQIRDEASLLLTKPLSNLAPIPSRITVDILYEKLQRRSIPIKLALLDQKLISGLGNIYVCEALWKAKVNPYKSAKALTFKEVKEVLKTSREILSKATKYGGSTVSTYKHLTSQGTYQRFLEVYARAGKPCSRCNTPITKEKINGRGTYYCKVCQKL